MCTVTTLEKPVIPADWTPRQIPPPPPPLPPHHGGKINKRQAGKQRYAVSWPPLLDTSSCAWGKCCHEAESIEWFIEGQAFSRAYPSPPPPRQLARPASPYRKTEKDKQLADEGGRKGWTRSRIIRPQESCSSINHSILSATRYEYIVHESAGSCLTRHPELVTGCCQVVVTRLPVHVTSARKCKIFSYDGKNRF